MHPRDHRLQEPDRVEDLPGLAFVPRGDPVPDQILQGRAGEDAPPGPGQQGGQLAALPGPDVAEDQGSRQVRRAPPEDPRVREWTGRGEVRKVVYIPGRLLNIVVAGQ